MLALAKRVRARILQASTSEVYGDPAVFPQTESYRENVSPIGVRSCYDEEKCCPETFFFDYHRQYFMQIKVARIFNTYGSQMHPNDGLVVSNCIVQALRGEDLTIYGNCRQTRSFCYVSDLIEGLLRLMQTGDFVTAPVNLGIPGEFTMPDLAQFVVELTGSKSEIRHEPLPSDDPRQRRPDISKAESLLDSRPSVQLRGGLARSIANFATTLASVPA